MINKKKNPDIYYTIEKEVSSEIKIKQSRFIANAAPVTNKESAMEYLEQIRSKYFDATHNCFAYLIGQDENEYRAADDGEPSGSAGKPILFSIKKFELSDIIVVVTRYFGGTKLGVGGLVRAYSEAADIALEKSKIKEIHITKRIKITCAYEELSSVKRLVDNEAVSFSEEYTDKVVIFAEIHLSKTENFIKTLIANTNGRAFAETA